jgi:L-ascorbate metabolism protein UlaG (beta-lactamase superfamily)
VRITFVGHSTVLIELDGTRVLTDPLLRERFIHVKRRVPPVDPAVASDIDVVLVSHAHHDHLDKPSLRKAGRNATVVVPRGARRHVPRFGIGAVEEIVEGEKLTLSGLEIEATHADHRAGRILYRGSAAIGFTVTGTKRVYFAGDTGIFPGMRDLREGLDVALIPISGWGTHLGSGHLDPASAAEALTLLAPRVVIPIHWGTYRSVNLRRSGPRLLADPSRAFARAAEERAPNVDVRVLEPGQSTIVAD